MRDALEFGMIFFFACVSAALAVVLATFGIIVAADYWNGAARAAIIEKQTGERYTWREAAQIRTMYDRQNVRISFEPEPDKNDSSK